MDSGITGIIANQGLGLYSFVVMLISLLLCGCIGLERELNGHAAGLRTHIIIGVTSTLAGVLAISKEAWAPYIIGAAFVSLGFLSAGSIVQTGKDVRGITTSSTVWVTGIIGMAIGLGFVLEALIATAFTVIVLVGLFYFEAKTSKRDPTYMAYLEPNAEAADKIIQTSVKYGLKVKNISSKISKFKNQDSLYVVVVFDKAPNATIKACCEELAGILQPLKDQIKVPRVY